MTTRRLAGLATTALVALAAAAGCPTAQAWWNTVAPTRSASGPYTVCPTGGRGIRCELIADPRLGVRKRGPVRAGAISRGPEQEVSPAFAGSGMEGGYAPSDLRSAYELPSGTAGTGQTVAVIEAYDDPHAEADLAEYRSEYGLSSCGATGGCFRKLDQHGAASPLPIANGQWGEEASFDLDMVSAVCPNCHILLIEAENAESQNVAAAENEAAALGATEISDSFVQSTPFEGTEAAAYDHPGVPIAVAAGDHGYGVVWPAASPHVIAVGGTTLEPPAGHGNWTETAWSKTGGGCSTEPKPSWQTDSECSGRTTNDVAAVADPNTPVSAYDSFETHGQPWLLAGGTSVAAPIVAASMALATSYTRTFDGAHSLYLEQANGISGFYDVSSGSTGSCTHRYLCEAVIGYDGPTGLGSLRGAPQVPPPTATTTGYSGGAPGEATLEGSVDPHGVAVSCTFEYGQTTYAEASAPCSPQPGTGVTTTAVTARLTGLTPGATYHYRVQASYAGGATGGSVLSFTAPSEKPAVSSESASEVSQTFATLSASVDPGGAAPETCRFEYGPTTKYGSSSQCTSFPSAGNAPVSVSATAVGLQAHAEYHFRLYVSAGPGRETPGSDETFETLPLIPSLATLPPSSIGDSSATLNATVDPEGGAVTSCEFEFGSGADFVPCSPSPGAGASPLAVSASVAGLAPSTRYLYRVTAANAGGEAYGPIGELTTASSPLGGGPGPLLPQLPTGPTVVTGSSDPPPSCAPHLLSRTLVESTSGRVKLNVQCSHPKASGRATVTLLLTGADSSRSGTSSLSATPLARASFTVPARGAAVVVLRLSSGARRLLDRTPLLHVRAVIVTKLATHSSTRSATANLRKNV